MAEEQIEIFNKTIEEHLLGPGSDVFANAKETEIISDYPLKRYYTGILYPRQKIESQGEKDEMMNTETEQSTESENNDIKRDVKDDTVVDTTLFKNHFYPSDMGISFCIANSVNNIDVEFSFATYRQPKQTEIKINMTTNAYDTLIEDKYYFPFRDILRHDRQNGYLSLTRELKGKKKDRRTEEYAKFDDWKKSIKDHKEILEPLYEQFNKIIARSWQREPIVITENIKLIDNNEPEPFSNFTDAGWTLKTYLEGGRKYIKIQLVNLFHHINAQGLSNKEKLNRSCLFQTKISIKSDKLLDYKPYKNRDNTDKEQQKLDFLYRDVKHFAIGSNCSAEWRPLENPNRIATSFVPIYDFKSTEAEIKDFDNIPLFDLSIWGDNQSKTADKLIQFISSYSRWIDEQKQADGANAKVGKDIIADLDLMLNRLKEGANLLANNEQLFKAFQYVNTAILLQFSLVQKNNFYQEIQNKLPDNPFQIKPANSYRPFQLAFLLLSLESVINPNSKYRKEVVDLIWFPTGGGKTESYLAVAALTIIWRRMNNDNSQGVSVIMRYTLRLLTAQQFERASRLITTLEYLRQKFRDDLKDKKIGIGLWIGISSTPNTISSAEKATVKIDEKGVSANKFQIDTCPWCGDKLIKENNGIYTHAFEASTSRKSFKIKCLNNDCHFHNDDKLPVHVVDEVLYDNPPALLFATVDKMAMLSWQEKGHKFFNSLGNENYLPPDLIVQDELHLLTGPLGSIVSLFETVIEDLCTKDGRVPKIIASTATTRNTDEQVRQLYGNRRVSIFPPAGISYDDSFFFKQSDKSNRQYLGFMPTGKTGIDSQIHLLTTIFIARLKVYLHDKNAIDPYWTIVSYYNSLRDVGRMSNKVSDEIQALIKQTQKRLALTKYSFNYYGLMIRTKELTSRIESAKIKQNLSKLEQHFELTENEKGYNNVTQDVVDLALATNMLSVGIDIERLNIMLINGMPRNTAEYIQASSRIGRKNKGLVVGFFDANRARDKSYFEHFLSFHRSLYKQIEPLSITPFTQNTITKMIASLLVTYVRHKSGLNKNTDVKRFTKDCVNGLNSLIKKRFKGSNNIDFCLHKIDDLVEDWDSKISKEYPYDKYQSNNKYQSRDSALLIKPDSKESLKDDKWIVMQSMRDIDSNSFIKIRTNFDYD